MRHGTYEERELRVPARDVTNDLLTLGSVVLSSHSSSGVNLALEFVESRRVDVGRDDDSDVVRERALERERAPKATRCASDKHDFASQATTSTVVARLSSPLKLCRLVDSPFAAASSSSSSADVLGRDHPRM